MLDNIMAETFEPHVDEAFVIHINDEEQLEAMLTEVKRSGRAAEGREGFSLLFTTPEKEKYAPQAIYTLSHATLGEMALFLVPLGPVAEGFLYESVFT